MLDNTVCPADNGTFAFGRGSAGRKQQPDLVAVDQHTPAIDEIAVRVDLMDGLNRTGSNLASLRVEISTPSSERSVCIYASRQLSTSSSASLSVVKWVLPGSLIHANGTLAKTQRTRSHG